jgi:hypothetical protein
MRNADALAAALAAVLPWSTSATAIVVVLWLIAVIATVEPRALLRSLARPASALPLALLALALVGTLWADSGWPARWHGVNPLAKFAVLPLLLYQFERSQRGLWVLVAFIASCAALMVLSWVVLYVPSLKLETTQSNGVPVKNYIDQSQEFALCMVVLFAPALRLFQERRWLLLAGCGVLILGFFANLMFAVSARTALVYLPVMVGLFGVVHLRPRAIVVLVLAAVVCGAAVWLTSPYLRQRVTAISTEYLAYRQGTSITSVGERLEFWRKSLKFVAAAPWFGNGTGAIRDLFTRDAAGQSGISAEVINNPHNQTLNVAVQWGLLGCIVLYAMWISHLLLFASRGVATGLAGWTGLLVVAQNMASSLLNSHLTDFHEGWMYVIGVGVAGGVVLGQRARAASPAGLGRAAEAGAAPSSEPSLGGTRP